MPYDRPTPIVPGIEATFLGVGHILGAASILLRADNRSIVFSGDIGRHHRPLLRDPGNCPAADYIVMESTYGDRVHEDSSHNADQLADIVNDTRRRGGNLIIPAFAVERAQELLYYLNDLLAADRIPHILVFLDSPMAVKVIEIFERNLPLLDEDMNRHVRDNLSPFHFPGFKPVHTVDESKAINHITGTVAVMAGAGMCTGGRIKHHLVNNISRPESTVLFVGYQAAGTLGRLIMEGASPVRIFGQSLPVKARVAHLPGCSAHADRDELLAWLQNVKSKPPRRIFVTHGEPESAAKFAETLRANAFEAAVPKYGDRAELA